MYFLIAEYYGHFVIKFINSIFATVIEKRQIAIEKEIQQLAGEKSKYLFI
jgi:hypothetical protein